METARKILDDHLRRDIAELLPWNVGERSNRTTGAASHQSGSYPRALKQSAHSGGEGVGDAVDGVPEALCGAPGGLARKRL